MEKANTNIVDKIENRDDTSKPKKKIKSEKKNVRSFNFKNGELYLRINYLSKVSHFFEKTEDNLLSSLYMTKIKRIKQRNSLKISSEYNRKICSCGMQISNKNNSNCQVQSMLIMFILSN